MFEMGAETMRLPLEEKMKYEQGDEGLSFGSVPYMNYLKYLPDALISGTRPRVLMLSMSAGHSTPSNSSTSPRMML